MSLSPLLLIGLCALLLGAGTAFAQDPASVKITEFAWRAPLTLTSGATAAQIRLPADAMVQLRSAMAQDIRVFNANGEAVAISRIAPAVTQADGGPERTAPFTALPLIESTSAQQPDGNAVRVQMDMAGNLANVWVRMANGTPSTSTGKPAGNTRELPAVLLDTRSEKRSITALQLEATLPANSLVNMTIWRSPDLVRWTEVAVKGPLFRFEGAGAPSNQVLTLQQPLLLQDQYLRLQWDDVASVRVVAAIGLVEPARQPASLVVTPLAGAVAEGNKSLTWPVEFELPMAALQLQTSRANTLVPVRVLGRSDTSQAWRQLAQGVVYRIGPAGQEKTNAAIGLNYGSGIRWLRVEASHGMALPVAGLTASAQFAPVQLVFLVSGPAPFELAVGRPDTPSAMVDPSVLRAVVTGPLDGLPVATSGPGRIQDISRWNERLMHLLPGGGEQRKLILWLVLGLGVLALGAVAFTLLRQLPAKPAMPTNRD